MLVFEYTNTPAIPETQCMAGVYSHYKAVFPFVCSCMVHAYTQRRVQPDQCYFTVQITGSNFECSL